MEKLTAAIITVSDKGSQGQREDLSMPEIKKILEHYDFEVKYYSIVADELEEIKNEIVKNVSNDISFIITTGGTGFSKRDVTPEATKLVIEKEIPGVGEYMRMNSLKYTNRSILTRGLCGIANNSVVLNLPGSPKACKENLEIVIEPLVHGIKTLLGLDRECGRK